MKQKPPKHETTSDNSPDYLLFALELQDLAAKSQQGSKQNYKIFLEKLLPHIRRYVKKRWWKDEVSIEDLVQDSMIAIHTNLHTYDTSRPILPWIKTIVAYKIADFARKHDRWEQHEISSEEIETFTDSFTNKESESFENADLVDKALAKLPKEHAEVIRLLKIHGMTLQEVADHTGLTLAAVKTYSHRAYKKLAEFRIDDEDG